MHSKPSSVTLGLSWLPQRTSHQSPLIGRPSSVHIGPHHAWKVQRPYRIPKLRSNVVPHQQISADSSSARLTVRRATLGTE
ncbi:hypothetical protein HYDPIDRAFT_106441 [Hydnomerulius pinastri MD-312]|nr:hypothetical protein HYDPIDRAFT_106441 [Hydnomerulius pinastri MD-312]